MTLNVNGSEYSVIRWTAPSTGLFAIAATFSAVSTIGATTDVHIQTNGISVFNSAVNGFPAHVVYGNRECRERGTHRFCRGLRQQRK